MTNYVLGVGILSVPERQQRLQQLLKQLDLAESTAALDMKHEGHVINWWRAADIAMHQPLHGNAQPTHALVIEDDAEPCPDFITAVQKLIKLYPDRTISFFTRDPVVNAVAVGNLAEVNDVPTDLAVVYPTKWLQVVKADYLKHIDDFARHKKRMGYGADELRRELRPNKQVWATVPSLVQHGCPVESTLGHRYPANVAARFIGTETSALSINWEASIK